MYNPDSYQRNYYDLKLVPESLTFFLLSEYDFELFASMQEKKNAQLFPSVLRFWAVYKKVLSNLQIDNNEIYLVLNGLIASEEFLGTNDKNARCFLLQAYKGYFLNQAKVLESDANSEEYQQTISFYKSIAWLLEGRINQIRVESESPEDQNISEPFDRNEDRRILENEKQSVRNDILKPLQLFKGTNLKKERICSDADYERIYQSVVATIENGLAEVRGGRVYSIHLTKGIIRYTFYLIAKAARVDKKIMIELLIALFENFSSDSYETISAHFHEVPKLYESTRLQAFSS
ncbi:MAG: hypothetical protein IT252_04295 [Chitinophagaceae bacterium]|nr:hypothetical protein [Chitinophagaceae bacterium]